MIDRPLLRMVILGLLYGTRMLTSYVLLLKLGDGLFKEVFTAVSLLSLTNLIFFGFPTGAKTVALDVKKANGDINSIVVLYNALTLVLFIGFTVLAIIKQEWTIAAFVFVMRLAATYEENKWEFLNYRYVVLIELLAELLLITVFLLDLSPLLVMVAVLIYCGAVALRGINWKIVKNARAFVLRAVGLRPAMLEFSSVLLFGLEAFWASTFMTNGEFVAYFFISRVFTGLTMLFGGLTRNYWAQGFLAGDQSARSMLRENFTIAWLLTVTAIIAAGLLIYFFDVILPKEIRADISYQDILVIIFFQFAYFMLQIINRMQKNRISIANRVLSVAHVSFIAAVCVTALYGIGFYLFPGNMIYFFAIKIVAFSSLAIYLSLSTSGIVK